MIPVVQDVLQHLRTAKFVNIVVASKNNNGFQLRRMDARTEVAEQFRGFARSYLNGLRRMEDLHAYEPGYKPDGHELLQLNPVTSANIIQIMRDMGNLAGMVRFQGNDEAFLRTLRFYAVVATTVDDATGAQEQAVFFKVFSVRKELNHGTKFAVMRRKDVFDQVTEPIFLFDKDYDCFFWRGSMYINKKSSFERIFEYFAELQATARATVDALHQTIPVQNMEEFRSACINQVTMAAKLASLAQKPHFQTLTMNSVKATIQQFGLPVEVVVQDGQEMLVFEGGPSKRWLILQLLDDDFLQSGMTGSQYAANSKRRVGG